MSNKLDIRMRTLENRKRAGLDEMADVCAKYCIAICNNEITSSNITGGMNNRKKQIRDAEVLEDMAQFMDTLKEIRPELMKLLQENYKKRIQ